jgi:hypothetical protein
MRQRPELFRTWKNASNAVSSGFLCFLCYPQHNSRSLHVSAANALNWREVKQILVPSRPDRWNRGSSRVRPNDWNPRAAGMISPVTVTRVFCVSSFCQHHSANLFPQYIRTAVEYDGRMMCGQNDGNPRAERHLGERHLGTHHFLAPACLHFFRIKLPAIGSARPPDP